MPTQTDPRSALAGDLFDLACRRLGSVVAGSRWMFSSQPELAGCSPIQALKAGKIDDVKRALMAVSERG